MRRQAPTCMHLFLPSWWGQRRSATRRGDWLPRFMAGGTGARARTARRATSRAWAWARAAADRARRGRGNSERSVASSWWSAVTFWRNLACRATGSVVPRKGTRGIEGLPTCARNPSREPLSRRRRPSTRLPPKWPPQLAAPVAVVDSESRQRRATGVLHCYQRRQAASIFFFCPSYYFRRDLPKLSFVRLKIKPARGRRRIIASYRLSFLCCRCPPVPVGLSYSTVSI